MKKGWEYKTLGDCAIKVQKQKQVKSKDYKETGKYPIVSQEKELISGYWDDESYLYRHIKPIIVFGDHTKEVKYIDFDFVVGADGTQLLMPKDGINPKYFYYVIKATPLRALGYARHFKLLKEKQYPVPPLSEQEEIVSRFDKAFEKIDTLRHNAEQSLTTAQQLFQSSLTNLLTPQPHWERKKFGEVCSYNKNQGRWSGLKYIGMEHIEAHTGILLDSSDSNTIESSSFKFQKGDLLYGRLRPYLQKVIIAPFEGCCSTEIFPIQSKLIIHCFLKYWFLTEKVTNMMVKSCSGCRMPRGDMNLLKEEMILFPPLSEQTAIALLKEVFE